jgi:hypothetical protein
MRLLKECLSMRKLYLVLLVLNLLSEVWIGAILLIKPGTGEALGTHTAWATDYGFAALAIASMIFWVWRYRYVSNVAGVALGILTLFHLGTGIATALAVPDGDPIAAPVIHGVLAIMSIALLLTRKRWCDSEPG